MIVRISGEDQYRLEDSLHGQLNQLDSTVLTAIDAGDEPAFKEAFVALLDFVRANGSRVGDDEIETSDLILPPDDITLSEAAEECTGEGLIPD
jgi:hypothetical protein